MSDDLHLHPVLLRAKALRDANPGMLDVFTEAKRQLAAEAEASVPNPDAIRADWQKYHDSHAQWGDWRCCAGCRMAEQRVPELLAEVERLRAEVARAKADAANKHARPCRDRDGCTNEALPFYHLCGEHHLSVHGYMPEDLPIAPAGCGYCSARPGQRHWSGFWCVRDFVRPAGTS